MGFISLAREGWNIGRTWTAPKFLDRQDVPGDLVKEIQATREAKLNSLAREGWNIGGSWTGPKILDRPSASGDLAGQIAPEG